MPLFSRIRTAVLAIGVFLGTSFAIGAPKDNNFDPFSASIEENIRTPEVGKKNKAPVVAAMTRLEHAMKEAGMNATRVREGEVVMVTIPCAVLFGPNRTDLRAEAEKSLMPLIPYIKRTDTYKVVVAVHSDDTGDAQYTDQLTADRASALDAFFSRHISGGETGIIPYGIGSDEPVAPNSGVRNRAANRRVEVYFIPTETFISKAKK